MSQSIRIYHNPRCSKSRQTLELLRQNGIKPEIVEYLKSPISESRLHEIVGLLGITAAELVRKKEKLFQKICPDQTPTDAEAIKMMAEHPELIERPIVVTDDQAVIGRPPENVLELL